jgi:hypothetical protein
MHIPHNRRTTQWPRYGGLLVIASLSALAGCGMVSLEPVLVREPRPQQIPLVVGVYYPTEFRSFVYRQTTGRRAPNSFAIGEASVRVLDETLSLLFKQVTPVSSPPPVEPPQAMMAGVIEPKISSVSYWVPDTGVSASPVRARAYVSYALTLYSPQGVRLAAWEVRGEGVDVATGSGFEVSISSRAVKRSLELAMRDAAWNLVTQFRDVPGVPDWLAERGVRSK